jgi:hypothetical protein
MTTRRLEQLGAMVAAAMLIDDLYRLSTRDFLRTLGSMRLTIDSG